MQFLTPTFLALAAIAGPIILLYMLRLRRQEFPISSTMLWQRLMQDREANAPWQKLRRNLLLLLQLLILAVLVFALARPFIPVPSVAAGSVAVLIDASASMNATDMPGGRTRFDAARDEARSLVANLASNEVMTIIAVGPTPEVLAPPTGDSAALLDALNRARPTQDPADWDSALALAGASIVGRPGASIVVISDGGLPSDLPALAAPVRYVKIGRESSNLAITALATRSLAGKPQLFAAVTNFSGQDADTILSLTVDGQLLSANKIAVKAGQTSNLTITDLPETTRVIEAQLSAPSSGGVKDYLPVDDTAYTVYAPPATGRVLLVTEGNLFLSQVLGALPNVQAFRQKPGDLPTDQSFDLIVLDGWLPPNLPPTNLLIVNPPNSTDIFSVGDKFDTTRFLKQADDPIMAFVSFKDVAIREATTVQTTGWAKSLVDADGGPLLLAGTVGGRRVAVLTFDLHASDLPLKIAFPILIANLMQWYAPSQPFDAPDGVKPASVLTIRPQATTTQYRITLPDGTQQTVPVGESALSFASTAQLGVYKVELLDGDKVQMASNFTVNLFSPAESKIAPSDTITIGQKPVGGPGQTDEFGQRELWPWLAAAALIVLAIEWWVYHRGSALPVRSRRAGTTQ